MEKSTRHSNLKERIVSVSKTLFRQKGYSETSIGEIIKMAETSKGNLYHHFESKEDLFLYILEDDMAKWIASWQDYIAKFSDPIEKLYALGKFPVETDYDYHFYRASEEFFASAFKSDLTQKRIDEIDKNYYDLVHDIVSECYEAKVISDKEDIAQLSSLLVATLTGIEFMSFNVDGVSKNDLYIKAIDLFLNGARQKKG
jgi:TetR/AcrR family transcriptional regulator, repressor for qacA